MSTFNLSIPVILRHEGGWVNDPDDPGGETNWGISTLIIKREEITAEELGLRDLRSLKNMTVEAAQKVYKRVYWDRYKYYEIENQLIATKVFDAAVNMGPYWGHLCAQKAANACGFKLEEDGKCGPKTREALSACPDEWLNQMTKAMTDRYNEIVKNSPRKKKFLKTWLRRAAWIG
jgi:type VI secretion system secreted protein VgrG